MPQNLFFSSSSQIASRITDLYDFVWPTAAAIWNLRYQVDKFILDNPSIDDETLLSNFVAGSGIHGINLRRACIKSTWDEQQEQLAKFLLIEICALYEAWLDYVFGELGINNNLKDSFQFPTNGNKGISNALTSLQISVSPELSASIYPTLVRNSKYSLFHIENLLKCYRYFKECRNSLIHHGGMANIKAVEAYAAFQPLTTINLGVTEIPDHTPIIQKGDPILLKLRGVVGLSDIVIRLIVTFDAEFSKVNNAETVLRDRWMEAYGRGLALPFDTIRKEKKIARLIKNLGLPKPISPDKLEPFLKRYGLVI
ncbi:MAG: hypothetical protein ACK5QS_10880 [Pseudanabaenaceae cyanobacterium]|jgi:hypothetical protein